MNTERDINRDMDLVARAWEYSTRMNPKLPDPHELIPLIRPMRFTRMKRGPYEIRPEYSLEFPITNSRMVVLLGVPLVSVQFTDGASFHTLRKDGKTMTSDKPIEIYQQYISFSHMHGRVLVGGLGLGMAATMILDLKDVHEVVVIEKSRQIIDLIGSQVHPKLKIIPGDLFEYLKRVPAGRFDSAYFDIWYGTAEDDWGRFVLPLYRLARKKGIETLGAWGEYEMNQQLRPALYKAAFSDLAASFLPYLLWRRGLMDKYKAHPPYPDARVSEIEDLIETYLTGIGMPEWEKLWGRAADVLVQDVAPR